MAPLALALAAALALPARAAPPTRAETAKTLGLKGYDDGSATQACKDALDQAAGSPDPSVKAAATQACRPTAGAPATGAAGDAPVGSGAAGGAVIDGARLGKKALALADALGKGRESEALPGGGAGPAAAGGASSKAGGAVSYSPAPAKKPVVGAVPSAGGAALDPALASLDGRFNRFVEDLNAKGLRRDGSGTWNGLINNWGGEYSRMLGLHNDASKYERCFDQAERLQTQLLDEKVAIYGKPGPKGSDAKWTTRLRSYERVSEDNPLAGVLNNGHWWVELTPRDPRDPKVELDPWANYIKITYPDGTVKVVPGRASAKK